VAAANRPEPLGFPKCAHCPLLETGSASTCYDCAGRVLPQHDGPTCVVCGQLMSGGWCGNRICHDPARGFGKAHVVAVHRDDLRTVNLRYKNDGKTGWARILARIVVGYLDEHVEFGEVDLILPNPSHGADRQHNERIINAARDEDPFWPFDHEPWALTKTAATPRSASNTLAEKLRVAKLHAEVIAVNRSAVEGKRILVYDDVFTTGAQLDQVGRLLKANGALSVDGLVLARAPWT
jgi:predicted amidophosphoribosyltransferase